MVIFIIYPQLQRFDANCGKLNLRVGTQKAKSSQITQKAHRSHRLVKHTLLKGVERVYEHVCCLADQRYQV